MALRRLSYIFIPVLAIILMSHNVFAVNGDNWNASGVYGFKSSSGGITMSNGGLADYSIQYGNSLRASFAPTNGSTMMRNFAFDMNGTVAANSIYYFQVKICSSSTNSFKFFGLSFRPDFAILQVDLGEPSQNSGSFPYCQSYNYKLFSTQPNYAIVGVDSRMLHIENGAVVDMNISPVSWITLGDDPNYTSALNSISDKQSQTNRKLDQLNQKNSEYYDKQYQSIDNIDDQSAGDISGTDNQNTTNLIGIFSSFVTAMGNASSSNCNFNGDFGNLDLGQMNFCQDNPPTVVQVIGSLVLIAVFVPLAYFLVNRIISEIRSFTNG